MSDHIIPAVAVGQTLFDALHQSFRRVPAVAAQPDGSQVYTYTPDLTPAETATLDLLVAAAAMSAPVTPVEVQSVRPLIQEGRAFRQLGRNAFMALSAAERDRLLYDTLVALIRVAIIDHREPEQSEQQVVRQPVRRSRQGR